MTDQQPTTQQLLILVDRAERGRPLTTDEAALLRTGVAELEHLRLHAEQLEDLLRIAHDTSNRSEAERARAVERAEQADAVTAETKRLMERRTTTLRQRAERAEAALERVTSLVRHYEHWGATGWQPYSVKPSQVAREFRAALDEHQEQP